VEKIKKIFKLNADKLYKTTRLLVVLVSNFDSSGGGAWQRMTYPD
jgi:hypothetical protein